MTDKKKGNKSMRRGLLPGDHPVHRVWRKIRDPLPREIGIEEERDLIDEPIAIESDQPILIYDHVIFDN